MEREARIGNNQCSPIALSEQAVPFKSGDMIGARGEEAQGFAKTIKFIETALAEGAHFKVPKRVSKDRWERDIDITLVYLLSDESLEDTGRIYSDITRERVRQIRNKTISDLWRNCSTETQVLFPFEELELEKPRSQKSRERISQAQGGKSVVFNRGLQAGKSIGEIREENGLSTLQIVASRYVLRKWGTEVPYTKYKDASFSK